MYSYKAFSTFSVLLLLVICFVMLTDIVSGTNNGNEGIALAIEKCEGSALLENTTIVIPAEMSSTMAPANFRVIPYHSFCAYGHRHKITVYRNNLARPKYQITKTGELIWPGLETEKVENINITTRDYCVIRSNYDLIEISICLVNCDNPNITCVPKCCNADELFNITSNSCQKSSTHWMPRFHHENEGHRFLSDSETRQLSLYILPMLKLCHPSFDAPHVAKGQQFIESQGGDTEIRLLTNGQVVSKWHEDEHWETFPDSCIDGEVIGVDSILMDLDCSVKPFDFSYEEQKAKMEVTINFVHAILMILCSLFLLFAIIIHIALWEKQNTHGWTVLTYIISLFFAYIFLAAYKFIATQENMSAGDFGCKFNGIIAHFFFQSVFTWLTVINFDIWWKFWDLKSQPIQAKDISKYILYALFAFGVPFFIIIVGLSLENAGTGIAPGYGYNGRCFLQHKALGVYLYYPVGALMILNFVFFVTTAFKIYSHFKLTSNVHETKSQQEMESFKVILKLFIVMGVTWVFELIGFMIQKESHDLWSTILWSILDCANILQALGIFIIFIWKRVILTQLWQKYPFLRPFLRLLKGLPGCKKRIDYHYSTRMTTKSTKSTNSANASTKKSQRNRKLSDSGQQTSFETVEL